MLFVLFGDNDLETISDVWRDNNRLDLSKKLSNKLCSNTVCVLYNTISIRSSNTHRLIGSLQEVEINLNIYRTFSSFSSSTSSKL